MPAVSRYRFDPFEIDVGRRLLLRNGAPVALTTKAFDTLLALVERGGQMVDKDALMRRLWPDTAVEEGNLTQQISTVRKALGEAPDDHQFIVTVARRGYQFVAPVAVVTDMSQPKAVLTVGRDREIAELRRAFEASATGSGLLLAISGEAGIGKSTLVARFLAEIGSECFALHGRCSERLAPGEPYLPVLEALEALLCRDPRPWTVETLAARAPSWYAQVAPLGHNVTIAGVPQPTGASQERQKRELATFLTALAQGRPVVLFIDDVHWADVSTLDLLLYLTSRLDAMPLLLIVAYRPAELLLAQDAFVQSLRDLRARGLARELMLGFLSREEVTRYIAGEFPNHAFPDEFPALVHERTEGSPLFLVDLLRDLRERGSIARRDSTWMLMMSLSEVAQDLPPSVRSVIERTIARLDEIDRQLLIANPSSLTDSLERRIGDQRTGKSNCRRPANLIVVDHTQILRADPAPKRADFASLTSVSETQRVSHVHPGESYY